MIRKVLKPRKKALPGTFQLRHAARPFWELRGVALAPDMRCVWKRDELGAPVSIHRKIWEKPL